MFSSADLGSPSLFDREKKEFRLFKVNGKNIAMQVRSPRRPDQVVDIFDKYTFWEIIFITKGKSHLNQCILSIFFYAFIVYLLKF